MIFIYQKDLFLQVVILEEVSQFYLEFKRQRDIILYLGLEISIIGLEVDVAYRESLFLVILIFFEERSKIIRLEGYDGDREYRVFEGSQGQLLWGKREEVVQG